MKQWVFKHGTGAGLAAIVVVVWAVEWVEQSRFLGASGGLIATVPLMIQVGSVAAAVFLLWKGWPRTRGSGIHCRNCGYHQEEAGRVVGPCPECGAPWRWIGRFRVGDRRGERWMVAVGLGLLFLVASTSIISRVAPWAMLRWMPTEVLIQRVALLPEDELSDEYNELTSRTPDPERMRWLAQALMRKRTRDGYLSAAGEETVFVWTRAATPQPQ